MMNDMTYNLDTAYDLRQRAQLLRNEIRDEVFEKLKKYLYVKKIYPNYSFWIRIKRIWVEIHPEYDNYIRVSFFRIISKYLADRGWGFKSSLFPKTDPDEEDFTYLLILRDYLSKDVEVKNEDDPDYIEATRMLGVF